MRNTFLQLDVSVTAGVSSGHGRRMSAALSLTPSNNAGMWLSHLVYKVLCCGYQLFKFLSTFYDSGAALARAT